MDQWLGQQLSMMVPDQQSMPAPAAESCCIRRFASSAMAAGSALPSTKAAKIARADTPMISVATGASLMWPAPRLRPPD